MTSGTLLRHKIVRLAKAGASRAEIAARCLVSFQAVDAVLREAVPVLLVPEQFTDPAPMPPAAPVAPEAVIVAPDAPVDAREADQAPVATAAEPAAAEPAPMPTDPAPAAPANTPPKINMPAAPRVVRQFPATPAPVPADPLIPATTVRRAIRPAPPRTPEPVPSKASQDAGWREESRALIEKAIAAGKVRRIPMGVSGMPDPSKSDPKAAARARKAARQRWKSGEHT